VPFLGDNKDSLRLTGHDSVLIGYPGSALASIAW
jgi:hypothetical protein